MFKFLERLKNKSGADILFVVIFCVLLIIPAIKINTAERSDREWRALAKFQPIISKDLKLNYDFGKNFNDWFSDRFNFRDEFLKINDVRYLLNNKVVAGTMLEGEDGWLFYNDKYSILSRQNVPYTDSELRSVGSYINSINEYCKRNGQHFYFVIAPDKSQLYEEFYNKNVKKQNSEFKGKAYQLVNYLKDMYGIDAYYFLDELVDKKADDYLYYKDDTHWTSLGAYYSYQKLMSDIKQNYSDIPLFKAKEFEYEYHLGDLNNQLSDFLRIEPNSVTYKKPVLNNKNINCNIGYDSGFCYNPNGKYKAIIYRDSFANALVPYFAESFQAFGYYRDTQVRKICLNGADIVIFEIVERNLPKLVDLELIDK